MYRVDGDRDDHDVYIDHLNLIVYNSLLNLLFLPIIYPF